MAFASSRRAFLSAALLAAVVAPRAVHAAPLPPMHRGFNTFPWLFRAKTIGGDQGQFDYERTFPYVDRFTEAQFAALHRAGADLIRVQVDVSPLVAGNPGQRASVIRQILGAVQRVTRSDMTVVIALSPHEGIKGWTGLDLLHTPQLLAGYKDGLVDLARAIVATGDRRIVLELWNEPPGGYGGSEGVYWLYTQPDLIKAVRAVAPKLPVVASGDRGGGIEGLLRVDPRSFDDPMILYSFHYYDPMVITHQGAGWGIRPEFKYMAHLDYPPVPSQASSVIEVFRDRVMADASRPDPDKQATARKGTAAIDDYFRRPQGPEKIRTDFAQVGDWARAHGIPGERLFLGEFGVLRPNASRDTVVHYLRDVRAAADGLGAPWAAFNFAPFDENGSGFSMLQMTGPTPTAFDRVVLDDGLGLHLP